MSEPSNPPENKPAVKWQALSAIERRVAGVLVEKAKTTPEAYPMTLNAICTGANQKNNRAPVMQLESDQCDTALERLRALGAVGLVEGVGRVPKYRHYLYDWLGVEKVEMAVMAELLLRGDQTEGELRGRASRMEPIGDLAALREVLQSLKDKNLVISLTSEGRGHVVSHNLYSPNELERLKAKYADDRAGVTSAALAAPVPAQPDPAQESALDDLRNQVAEITSRVESLAQRLAAAETELQALRRELGG